MVFRVCALLLAILGYAEPAYADQRWIVAGDIHLDPFASGRAPAAPGSDSNVALLDSAIGQMRRVEHAPRLVILTGDFLAHHFGALARDEGQVPNVAALRTMRDIAAKFGRAFPHAHFLVVMGNNDDPCGDYQTSVDSAYLRALAQIWAPLVNRDGASKDFEVLFARGGYYVAALPDSRRRAIVLNSVYWSFRYRNACGSARQAPGSDEFAWLRDALKITPPGERNLVIMHIPPGPDANSTSLIHGIAIVPFLTAPDDDRLRALLSDPRSRVAWVLAGHTHRTEIRVLGDVPMLIAPSISPVYRNDPAFFVAQMTPAGQLADYAAYVYSERAKQWTTAYHLDATFHIASLTGPALRALHARELAGWKPPAASAFVVDRFTVCAQTAPAAKVFATCASVPNRRAVWLLTASGGVIVLGIAGLVLARRRRHGTQ